MVGITSYGIHIPVHRLSRAMIAESWQAGGMAGERAVANFDEDSLTMAVAAARDCLNRIPAASIDALYLATTSAPYKEKQSAALIAAVLQCGSETQTLDFGNCLRSGTSAINAAVQAVAGGRIKTALVCMSDMRLAHPKSYHEMLFGDGAAAFLISNENVIAEVEHFHSIFDEIQDVWRSDQDLFVRAAEARFSEDYGYARVVKHAVSGALKAFDLKPEGFGAICSNFGSMNMARKLFSSMGFQPEKQMYDDLHRAVGDTGTALSLMYLIRALEQAKPNQRILISNYGNGCDVICLKTTESIQEFKPRSGLSHQLQNKMTLSSYNKYLIWRELVEVQPPARPPVSERQPTPSAQFRETRGELALNGTRCTVCQTPQYPPQRVCMICKAKDQFVPHDFSHARAKVFTFSHDYIMETLDPPVTLTIADFNGGGRIMCDMTDRDPEKVHVGMDVEMTFRKLYYVGGIYNYWWKCKPAYY
jgi:3-hydroxy-3-methylglutaryl CoA synthase/uncharacterized OB-fold protein